MSCTCPSIDLNISCPNDLYEEIIKTVWDLGVVITTQEKEDLKNSRRVDASFLPAKHSTSFFNVRIKIDRYSMVRHSDHEGFAEV